MPDIPQFVPSLVKRQIRARGPVEAIVVNDTLDELHSDIQALTDGFNRIQLDLDRAKRIASEEALTLRERVRELEGRITAQHQFAANANETLVFNTTFGDLSAFDFSGFPVSRRLRVDTAYGSATVPYNAYRSRFHIVDTRTSKLFVPSNLKITINGIDEGDGEVTEGTPANAFNGQNESFWLRAIAFPLADDRDSVTLQMDVEVPLTFAQESNVLVINPYPQGQIDILSVTYSVDTSTPSTPLPGFPSGGIKDAKATKLYFAPIAITRLRITLRQRHWVEREELKVFSYGAQEIDLGLVEFDKTSDPSILNNHGAVVRIDAPEGFTFSRITDFVSEATWETGSEATGIFFQLYTNASLSTLVWNSFTDPAPSATPVNVSAFATNTLYLAIILRYKQSAQITPNLTRAGFAYTVTD
jgi:hypothetical protein